jgi:aminotransferase/cystathionine beta-lyase
MFTNNDINFEALKRKAYNGRWATLEDGIIPLTAADPDSEQPLK